MPSYYLQALQTEFDIKANKPKTPKKIIAQISNWTMKLRGFCFAIKTIPPDSIKRSKM